MKKQFYIVILLLFNILLTFSQSQLSNGSKLPLIILDTYGAEIVDDPKITASMKVIARTDGRLNYTNDKPTDYSGKIGIEVRGQSSQMFPKKAFGIEIRNESGLDTAVSLLGLPAESDWVLYAAYNEKTLIRNALMYELGNRSGLWAPHTRFCEVVLNGQYWGIYLLTEKIKRDKGRVNISKLKKTDLSGSDVTGGYILKIDKGFYDGIGFRSIYNSAYNTPITFEYVYPKPDSIQAQQVGYIKSFMTNFENSLKGNNFKDPIAGYRQFANVTSFADYYLFNEFSKNVDGYRISTYMFKDRTDKGGKLTMGPLWDYDLTLGNADYYDGWKTSGWAAYSTPEWDGAQPPFWWNRMLQDEEYTNLLQCRWTKFRSTFMSDASLMHIIDSIAAIPSSALSRNFTAWPVFGQYVWPNYFVGNNYKEEINYLKDWIVERASWIDDNLPGTCTTTSIDNNEIANERLIVFPNPFTNWICVQVSAKISGNYKLEICNNQNQILVSQIRYYNGNSLIDWRIDFNTQLASGLYFVKLISPNGNTQTAKIIKN